VNEVRILGILEFLVAMVSAIILGGKYVGSIVYYVGDGW